MKNAVLGLVVERRGYGYDLISRFNTRFGEAWDLNHSTVYTALDKLERERCIREHEADEGPRLGQPTVRSRSTRRQHIVVYEATPKGEDQFRTWVTAPTTDIDPVRADVFLKVGLTLTQQLALPLIQVLDAQIDAHASELARYVSQYHLDAGTRERIGWTDAVPWFMIEAAIGRLQADLNWLRRMRAAAELYRDHGFLPMSALAPRLGGGKPLG